MSKKGSDDGSSKKGRGFGKKLKVKQRSTRDLARGISSGLNSSDSSQFDFKVDNTVPISPYLLTPAVLACNPDEKDIASYTNRETRAGRVRKIFLNTPLDDEEQKWLEDARNFLDEKKISLHPTIEKDLLRFLQHAKGNVESTETLLEQNMGFKRLIMPLSDEEILNELRSGFMYWHGRDRKQRPILVVQTAFLNSDLKPSDIVRLVSFTLEWMIQYGLVPGRVENWTVLVDLQKTGLRSFSVETVRTLVTTLHMNYRFRNTKVLIVNCPWIGTSIYKMISGILPADTKDKVTFCSGSDTQKLLEEIVEMRQLEKKFGGTAEDCTEPEHYYPYRFFPDETKQESFNKVPANFISKGFLWETHESAPHGTKENMEKLAVPHLLTPNTAEYLTTLLKLEKLPDKKPTAEEMLQAIETYCLDPIPVDGDSLQTSQELAGSKALVPQINVSNEDGFEGKNSLRSPRNRPLTPPMNNSPRNTVCSRGSRLRTGGTIQDIEVPAEIAEIEKEGVKQREDANYQGLVKVCQEITDHVNKGDMDAAVKVLRKRVDQVEAQVIDEIELQDVAINCTAVMTTEPGPQSDDETSREKSEPVEDYSNMKDDPGPSDPMPDQGTDTLKNGMSTIPENSDGVILDDDAPVQGWCCRAAKPAGNRGSKASKGSKGSKASPMPSPRQKNSF